MPKTTNLEIEITDDDSTLFSVWREYINGNNPSSMANIIDAAYGAIIPYVPSVYIWTGTQAAYDAIETKNPTTLYFITE